jgi:NAD+ synthetase
VGNIKKRCLSKSLPLGNKLDYKLAKANLLVRLRMSLLYFYAAVTNSPVLGTGDKSELQLGYFTKFGDGAADLFPLADLYKTQVKELARRLPIPKSILDKKSSDSISQYSLSMLLFLKSGFWESNFDWVPKGCVNHD